MASRTSPPRPAMSGRTAGRPTRQGDRRRHRRTGAGRAAGTPLMASCTSASTARAAEIEVVAQRLEDRRFQRGPARPAAQRQRDGEAGEAEHEDEAGDAGDAARSAGHSIRRKTWPPVHAELAGQTPALARHGLQRGEKGARRERHVEEDMGDQDSRQAVEESAGRKPDARHQPMQPAAFAVQRHDGEDGDDGRHHHGQAEQPQQQGAAGKVAAPGQRPGHGDRRAATESRPDSPACRQVNSRTWRR